MPPHERLLRESDSDTPRVFEYLRRQIVTYYESSPRKSLVEACRSAIRNLLAADRSGTFNVILSNGFLSFAFIHHRPWYLLHRAKDTGDVAGLSTPRLTDDEERIRFEKGARKNAKLLVFSVPTLLLNSDL